jgi:hypothetical protein
MQTPLIDFLSPRFVGAYGLNALLLPAAQAVPVYEGPWIQIGGAKDISLELFGSQSTLSVDIYGTNNPNPVNGYTITIGSTVTSGDTITATFTNPNLPGAGTEAVVVTAGSSDTTTTLAVALAAAINADVNLQGCGISAQQAGAIVTINFPSIWPGGDTAGGTPQGVANFTGVTTTLSAGASETAAVATLTNGTKIGSSLAAFGFTELTTLPTYIKARLQTLTGTGANVTVALNASI